MKTHFFCFFVSLFFFEMSSCVIFLQLTHPLSFSLYFFWGTFYNDITFTKINKHNNNLNTKTTFKINKTPDRKHCWQLEPRRAVVARRPTRLRHWRRVVPRATTRGAKQQEVDQPLPFLFSPAMTCKTDKNTTQQHKQSSGFRYQICCFSFKWQLQCRGGCIVADLLAAAMDNRRAAGGEGGQHYCCRRRRWKR